MVFKDNISLLSSESKAAFKCMEKEDAINTLLPFLRLVMMNRLETSILDELLTKILIVSFFPFVSESVYPP